MPAAIEPLSRYAPADPLAAVDGPRTRLATATASAASQAAAKTGKLDAAGQFEAFVMQSFIQELLPDDAEGVFGKGVAGGIWRSMLAEQLAAQVTQRGDLGIADSIRADTAAKIAREAPHRADPATAASAVAAATAPKPAEPLP